MGVRDYAKKWVQANNQSEHIENFKSSKYFPEKDIWFITPPISYFDLNKPGNIHILLQRENDMEKFIHLKIPYSFFRNNCSKFDIRSDGSRFDLHISAKQRNFLECERGNDINFRKFEVQHC